MEETETLVAKRGLGRKGTREGLAMGETRGRKSSN